MRRRRRNPSGKAIAIGVGAAALLGGAVFALVKSTKTAGAMTSAGGTQFVTSPTQGFVGMTAGDTSALLVGDCIVANNFSGGFSVPDIAAGENVLLKVTARSVDGGRTLTAQPIDPRLPVGMPEMQIPAGAISGAGEC